MKKEKDDDKKMPEVVSKKELNERAKGSLIYRHLPDDERKKVSDIAEEIAEEYGLIINIIEK